MLRGLQQKMLMKVVGSRRYPGEAQPDFMKRGNRKVAHLNVFGVTLSRDGTFSNCLDARVAKAQAAFFAQRALNAIPPAMSFAIHLATYKASEIADIINNDDRRYS